MTRDSYKLVIREIDGKYTFFNLYNEESNEDLFRVYFYKDMWDKLDEYIETSVMSASENTHAILNSRYNPSEDPNEFLNECIQTIARLKMENNDIKIVKEKFTKEEHCDDPRAYIEVDE